jgi:hypothetical protein
LPVSYPDIGDLVRLRRVSKEIEFGPWTIRADVPATERAYAQVAHGSAEGCSCDSCQNFIGVRASAYPPDVLECLKELGVDFKKETELSRYARLPSGLHLYRGRFYVVGSIAEGPDAWITINEKQRKANFYGVSPTFEIGVSRSDNPRPPFAGTPCVQLDFHTEVPWRSDRPEPRD